MITKFTADSTGELPDETLSVEEALALLDAGGLVCDGEVIYNKNNDDKIGRRTWFERSFLGDIDRSRFPPQSDRRLRPFLDDNTRGFVKMLNRLGR